VPELRASRKHSCVNQFVNEMRLVARQVHKLCELYSFAAINVSIIKYHEAMCEQTELSFVAVFPLSSRILENILKLCLFCPDTISTTVVLKMCA